MHTPVVHLPNHCEPEVGATTRSDKHENGFHGCCLNELVVKWIFSLLSFFFVGFFLGDFGPMSVRFSSKNGSRCTSRQRRLKPRNSLGRAFRALLEVDHHRVSNFIVNSGINYPRYHQISWISAINSRQG